MSEKADFFASGLPASAIRTINAARPVRIHPIRRERQIDDSLSLQCGVRGDVSDAGFCRLAAFERPRLLRPTVPQWRLLSAVRELEFSYQSRTSAAINHALASLVSGTDNRMCPSRQSRIAREYPMPLGKQAKILSDRQARAILAELASR